MTVKSTLSNSLPGTEVHSVHFQWHRDTATFHMDCNVAVDQKRVTRNYRWYLSNLLLNSKGYSTKNREKVLLRANAPWITKQHGCVWMFQALASCPFSKNTFNVKKEV
jgi:hypothetical protein